MAGIEVMFYTQIKEAIVKLNIVQKAQDKDFNIA